MVMPRNVLGRQRTELYHKKSEVNVLEKYVSNCLFSLVIFTNLSSLNILIHHLVPKVAMPCYLHAFYLKMFI
jgi:hypothetical protein